MKGFELVKLLKIYKQDISALKEKLYSTGAYVVRYKAKAERLEKENAELRNEIQRLKSSSICIRKTENGLAIGVVRG